MSCTTTPTASAWSPSRPSGWTPRCAPPFERDRARVVHAAASRRLAAKTQVVGPQTDDFVRNRLTHSLEVAQVARDLARALGCHPDITETAALAHDLGHPPFGHNGERVLAELGQDCGGFEGNAQTLRLLTRLEAKTFDAERARWGSTSPAPPSTPAPSTPGPAPTRPTPGRARRRHAPRRGQVRGLRRRRPGLRLAAARASPARRKCVEAQVMDLADDVAYSVHDVEDGIVAGRLDLTRLDLDALWETVRAWYLPDGDRRRARRRRWTRCGGRRAGPTTAYDGSGATWRRSRTSPAT